MFKTIEEIEDTIGLEFTNEEKLQEELIIKIYNNNFEKHDDYDIFTLTQIGNYYKLIEQNYEQMEKYYLLGY